MMTIQQYYIWKHMTKGQQRIFRVYWNILNYCRGLRSKHPE